MKKITDVYLRNLKPADQVQRIAIGEGKGCLYGFSLQEKKGWYLRYYSGKKRQIVSLGTYPAYP